MISSIHFSSPMFNLNDNSHDSDRQAHIGIVNYNSLYRLLAKPHQPVFSSRQTPAAATEDEKKCHLHLTSAPDRPMRSLLPHNVRILSFPIHIHIHIQITIEAFLIAPAQYRYLILTHTSPTVFSPRPPRELPAPNGGSQRPASRPGTGFHTRRATGRGRRDRKWAVHRNGTSSKSGSLPQIFLGFSLSRVSSVPARPAPFPHS